MEATENGDVLACGCMVVLLLLLAALFGIGMSIGSAIVEALLA